MTSEADFWKKKSLAEMNAAEWESLCDGCGYCCLVKLEDEQDGAVYTTNVSCSLLDLETCQCKDYPNRQAKVTSCLVLDVETPMAFSLLPESCAYRRLHQGQGLPDWHPLLSQDKQTVKVGGMFVCEYAVSEDYIHPDQLQDHVIHQLK